jgi:hypothetical protein
MGMSSHGNENPRPDTLLLKPLLVPAPDDLLVVRPTSLLGDNIKHEGPGLLEDLSLFGQ